MSLLLLRLASSKFRRSFFIGQLSIDAEPIGDVIGGLPVAHLQPLFPFALAVPSSAMLFVVILRDSLIRQTRQSGGSRDLACCRLICGLAIMMVLEAGL